MTATRKRQDNPAFDERIVAFPLSGRTSKVRHCARDLENIHGEAATLYWRKECGALADGLRDIGCTPEDVTAQVMAFQTEVQIELMRRYSERLEEQLTKA